VRIITEDPHAVHREQQLNWRFATPLLARKKFSSMALVFMSHQLESNKEIVPCAFSIQRDNLVRTSSFVPSLNYFRLLHIDYICSKELTYVFWILLDETRQTSIHLGLPSGALYCLQSSVRSILDCCAAVCQYRHIRWIGRVQNRFVSWAVHCRLYKNTDHDYRTVNQIRKLDSLDGGS